MRHRVLLLSFVSLIALQTFAASPLLTRLYEKKHDESWAGYGDGVVETVLNDAKESRSADDLIARIRKSQRVTSESADAIAVAVMASDNGETLQADYAAIERMLLHAYATETNRAPLLTTLGSIAGYANDPEAAQRQLIELAGNDTTLAIAAGRVVVLSAAEHELYEKKFGPTYASSILNFVISHDGTRAILELNSSWAGATYLVKKTERGWETEILTSWIS